MRCVLWNFFLSILRRFEHLPSSYNCLTCCSLYNPTVEIDSFGLAFGKSMPAGGWKYGNMPKPKRYQLHHILPKSLSNGADPHEIFELSGYDVNNMRKTIYDILTY